MSMLILVNRVGEPTQEIYLDGPLTIGRAANNAISLPDEPSADRLHARVIGDGVGRLLLRCESENWVLVNGRPSTMLGLGPGTAFDIGGTHFECVEEAGRNGPGAPLPPWPEDLQTIASELLVLFRETANFHRRLDGAPAALREAEDGVREFLRTVEAAPDLDALPIVAARLSKRLAAARDEVGRPLPSRWRPDNWQRRWLAVLRGDPLKERLSSLLEGQ